MFKYLIVSLTIAYCYAGNLNRGLGLSGGYSLGLSGGLGKGGGGYGLGNGLGGGLVLGLSGNGIGLGNGGLGLGYGGNGYASSPGPVHAAIQSRRTYQVVPVASLQEPAIPQVIEIGPSEQPVTIIFRSLSSPVHVQQIHTPGAPGQVESTQSEDEPHRVLHEVLRPVIQEVKEVIQPYRRVTQEVRPVLEEVHTVVAKGERKGSYGGGAVIADAGVLDGGYGLSGGLGVVGGGIGYGKGAVLDGGLGLGNGGLGLGYSKGGYSKSAKKAA